MIKSVKLDSLIAPLRVGVEPLEEVAGVERRSPTGLDDRSDLVRTSFFGRLPTSRSQLEATREPALGALVGPNTSLYEVHQLLDDSNLLLLWVLHLHTSKSLSV